MRKYITKDTLKKSIAPKPIKPAIRGDISPKPLIESAPVENKVQAQAPVQETGLKDVPIVADNNGAKTIPVGPDSNTKPQNPGTPVSNGQENKIANNVANNSAEKPKDFLVPKKVQVKSGPTQKEYTKDERDRAVIEVRELVKNFYVGNQEIKVLKSVSVQVNQGDFLVILGPSGCGKSTLLHILLGLELPTAGEVKFLGRNIYDGTNEDDRTQFRKEHIGMIYQQPNWIKSMTVIENVAFPLILRGYQKEMALEIAHEAIDLVHMAQWENQIPTELSGGQQQRVALARCIVHNPEVVVADEPTGNLDYESGIEVMELLQRMNVDNKKTMIMVTHDIEYVKYATCAIRVFDGQILGYFTKENMGDLVSQLQTKRIDKSQM